MTQTEFYKRQIKGITVGMAATIFTTMLSVLISTVVITNKIATYTIGVDNRINDVTKTAAINTLRIDAHDKKLIEQDKEISLIKNTVYPKN